MEYRTTTSEEKKVQEVEDGGGGCVRGGYADDLNELFLCFICLELVHKPVVNACGHMFCFWCVHQAMNVGTESYCPLCRRPYIHFPRICEQLHFLLLKAVPEAYRHRCKEVYEEEVATCVFSPQFNDGLHFDVSGEQSTDFHSESTRRVGCSDSAGLAPSQHIREEKGSSVDVQDDHILNGKLLDASSSSSCQETCLTVSSRQCSGASSYNSDEGMPSWRPYVTTSDLLCNSCKKLLYRPVVVNCGHVFCEGCVTRVDDAGDATLKCVTCGSIHPGAFPHVCLELHQYLEQNFSAEYEKRRIELATESSELKKARTNTDQDLQSSDLSMKVKIFTPRPHPRMHASIGCDGCGMFPILGRRFKCIECPQPPGYDLCVHCYKNGTNLVGRFNQQHTSEHQIVEDLGNPSPFDDELQDADEASEGLETYFGIVGYFA